MRIVLYGINGLYNYGCEAMVRGISERLTDVFPNCDVVYKTFRYEQDFKVLSDCDTVTVEPIVPIINPIHKKAIRFFGDQWVFQNLRIICTLILHGLKRAICW